VFRSRKDFSLRIFDADQRGHNLLIGNPWPWQFTKERWKTSRTELWQASEGKRGYEGVARRLFAWRLWKTRASSERTSKEDYLCDSVKREPAHKQEHDSAKDQLLFHGHLPDN
jgi:hypothetical protein